MKNSPVIPRTHQLVKLSKEINDREEVLATTKLQARDKVFNWVCEAKLQGLALLQAKAMLNHGDFMPWVASHCPLISHDTANLYMRIASNSERVRNLDEAGSLREALAMISDSVPRPEVADDATPPKSWPPYIEALGRLSKFTLLVKKSPLAQWPAQGRTELLAQLKPIVCELEAMESRGDQAGSMRTTVITL